MTRATTAAGYWLNHVALTTDVRVNEKVGPVFFTPQNKEAVKQEEEKEETTGREREKQRAQMTAECLTAKNERKRCEGG